MAPSRPGPGSFGGGRGTDYQASNEAKHHGGRPAAGDASLGAEEPPVRADYKIGWSTDQIQPTQGPRAEKEDRK